MLTINLGARSRNKAFILSMVGAIVLLIQQLGFKDLIPNNYSDIVNSVLSILVMLGIVVDPSTPGISDQVVATTTVQAINTSEEVKTEDSTTSINNTVTENSQSDSSDASVSSSNKESETNTNTDTSASSKVVVDNPDNIQEAGKEVNAKAATSPSAN